MSIYGRKRPPTVSTQNQATYYACAFQNIRLVRLDEGEILAHLEKCGVPQPVIGIVGNDSATYEWDMENDALVRKYNCVYYDCTAFFTNTAKDLAIPVRRQLQGKEGRGGRSGTLRPGETLGEAPLHLLPAADGAYPRSWYYLMPELDEKLFRYFLYATGDLGFGGSNEEKGFQQYWTRQL